MQELISSIFTLLVPPIIAFLFGTLLSTTKYHYISIRLSYGFITFWFLYFIFPALVLYIAGLEPAWSYAISWEEVYMLTFSNMASGFLIMLNYPLVMYPLIFFIAPFISFLILIPYVGLRGLKEISIWSDYMAFKKLRDWSEEKEMLKLSLALLPLSLYLLTTILRILGFEENPLILGKTSLGWALEVYTIYLFSFLVAVHMISSMQVYFRNSSIGEKIKNSIFTNILAISLILSILSLTFFIQQNPASIYVLFFYSGYYMMSSIIFILFLRIFEPTSMYIFSKFILMIKGEGENKVRSSDLSYSLLLSVFVISISTIYETLYQYISFDMQRNSLVLINASLVGLSPSVNVLNRLNYFLILSNLSMFFDLFLMASIMVIGILYLRLKPSYVIMCTALIKMVLNIVLPGGGAFTYWITSAPSEVYLTNVNFFSIRFAFLELSYGFESILSMMYFPFEILRIPSSICILSILAYLEYGGVEQTTIVCPKRIFRIVGWRASWPKSDKNLNRLVIVLVRGRPDESELSDDEKRLIDYLSKNVSSFQELLRWFGGDGKIVSTVSKLYEEGLLALYDPDIKISLPTPEVMGIFIVMKDGRGVYNEIFGEHEIAPELISGMISAIISFVKETTKSSDYLRLIDHGDIAFILEYGEYIFSSLIADRDSAELRIRLRNFIREFEGKYGNILKNWDGNLTAFPDIKELVREKILLALK
ncbi:MAG: hypothetical protein ACTSVF_05385 [Candidatus Asgardarchaeia archaeon]